jgi:hypothetical protein
MTPVPPTSRFRTGVMLVAALSTQFRERRPVSLLCFLLKFVWLAILDVGYLASIVTRPKVSKLRGASCLYEGRICLKRCMVAR